MVLIEKDAKQKARKKLAELDNEFENLKKATQCTASDAVSEIQKESEEAKKDVRNLRETLR